MKGKLLNNRYHIVKTIGQEDFSASFLAIDTHLPSQPRCFIKKLQVILGNYQVKTVKQRFEREAAILESLGAEKAQIPQLYAYFAEGGDFYLVQEWIEGITLQQKQQEVGQVPEHEVRGILLGLLPLLDYVHSRHIVHRNIKPENIILRAEDNLPVLVGFNVVKKFMAIANLNQSAQYSMVVGTPEYMPAEQAIGRPIYSSDLYSLGLTAIFLLTGKSPSTFKYDSLKEQLLWHDRSPHLKTNLGSIIDRAIRSHPGDRFASASAMLSALQATVICLNPLELSISKMEAGVDVTSKTVTVSEAQNKQTKELQLSDISLYRNPLNSNKILLKALIAGISIGVLLIGVWQKLFKPVPQLESIEESSYLEQLKLFESQPVVQRTTLNLNNLPIFMPGVSQAEILQALGEPTKRQRGYWSDSRAWLYENIVPNKMDLSFLLDSKTQILRQTEINFAASVEQETIQDVLHSLLSDRSAVTVNQALAKVYLRQSDRQEFQVGNMKGIIERKAKDRIYTAVWDADFH